jgi:ABC-type polysaccharide/polyol phosphate export permease
MIHKIRQKNDLYDALLSFELWTYMARHDIKIRYRRSRIGPFWITLSMAIFCVTLGVVYSKLFKTEISELLPFLSIGLVVWGLVSSCLGEMPNLFVDNAIYMKDMYINPLTVLLRALTRNCIIFTHNLLIIVGIYLYFGIWPGWAGLLAIPGFMLVMLNLTVIGIPLSIIGARFRDVAQINQNLLQVIFFITPIFWFPRLLTEGSWIVAGNPVGYFMDLIRSPLLGHPPKLLSWEVSGLTFLTTSIIALWIYRSKSARIAFWV